MKIKNFVAKNAKKAVHFVEDHAVELVCGTLVVGSVIISNAGFNRGYESRKRFEEACDSATGSDVVKQLDAFSKSIGF